MNQLLRFSIVGVFNTAFGLTSIYVLMRVMGVDYRLANAIGFALVVFISFWLNRTWTFRHEGVWWQSLVRWLAVVAVAYALNLATVVLVHTSLSIDAFLAQLCGCVVYTATSFAGARLFAFAVRGMAPDTSSR